MFSCFIIAVLKKISIHNKTLYQAFPPYRPFALNFTCGYTMLYACDKI